MQKGKFFFSFFFLFKLRFLNWKDYFKREQGRLCYCVCNGCYADDFTTPQLQCILVAPCQTRLCLFHKSLCSAYKSRSSTSQALEGGGVRSHFLLRGQEGINS
ncbi:UNVERIFIED_CONTAM: hypothetical protein K2H54_012323 [Gekko kuhli]